MAHRHLDLFIVPFPGGPPGFSISAVAICIDLSTHGGKNLGIHPWFPFSVISHIQSPTLPISQKNCLSSILMPTSFLATISHLKYLTNFLMGPPVCSCASLYIHSLLSPPWPSSRTNESLFWLIWKIKLITWQSGLKVSNYPNHVQTKNLFFKYDTQDPPSSSYFLYLCL